MSSRSQVGVKSPLRTWMTGVFLVLFAGSLSLGMFPGSASASGIETRPALDSTVAWPGQTATSSAQPGDDRVEPEAGSWHTWVLSSGSQIVPPPPPDKKATRDESEILKQLAEQRDAPVMDRIRYWNSGAPAYRWNEIAVSEMVNRGLNTLIAGRDLALIHAAVSDATIAAWHAKYLYNRERPSEFDPTLKPAIDVPNSPSYPAEHAVAAGAASKVLAYLFEDKAGVFEAMAEEAANAFASAGINYPKDVEAGLELGRQVATLVIDRGKSDGSDLKWTGTLPEPGPCTWRGQGPVLPQAANWKTWVLSSPSEFRPPAPLDCNSDEFAAQMAEVKNFQRDFRSNVLGQFWEWGAGGARGYWFWNQQLSSKLFEYKLDDNPPLTARAYALESIAYHDSIVACWDAKYTYWAIRPFQFDSTLQTLFAPPPNHPSYPSAHSCLSGAAAKVLGYLFPYAANDLAALAHQAGEARIWAGLHFRNDIDAGDRLAEQVAAKAIAAVSMDEVRK